MKLKGVEVLVLIFVLAGCKPGSGDHCPFQFQEDENGVLLTEKGNRVFCYRKSPKSLNGEYVCNHYIHPLYAINGDTLTEEFPPDHPYHRGIFWSWHQLYADSLSLGDDWVMDGISHGVECIHTCCHRNKALLELKVIWKSFSRSEEMPFMEEMTRIEVHPLEKGMRTIDFTISLRALIPDLSIGGANNEKGYGGFCTRLKLPDDLSFVSEGGTVEPTTLQLKAGSWMDIRGSFGASGRKSGITICCHPDTPNHPAPWILRKKSSMQNIVFPGRERVAISMEEPTVLRYRLIVHEGNTTGNGMARLQTEFEETVFVQ